MKNETARREIESLDYYLQNHTDDYSEESHTAMMMAIKALEAQESSSEKPNKSGMTAEEQIKRITELLNDMDLDDVSYAKFEEMFMKQSINDIRDELWSLYCFVEDVCVTLNM